MNTKGASAAGKSTMRPEQKALAERLGVAWNDFALISPDIWRKQLLDYASLGAAYKYGGACTSEELQIIDQKLDRYMARKAERQATTHLLIDRFRFDSFAPESAEAGSNLLAAYKRAVNIVRAEEKKDKTLAAKIAGMPDVALLEQAEEKAVASTLAEVERAVKPALAREDFAGAMAAFATLRAPMCSVRFT